MSQFSDDSLSRIVRYCFLVHSNDLRYLAGVILAALRSGLIALAIALVILGWQYPIQKLGFAILSGT